MNQSGETIASGTSMPGYVPPPGAPLSRPARVGTCQPGLSGLETAGPKGPGKGGRYSSGTGCGDAGRGVEWGSPAVFSQLVQFPAPFWRPWTRLGTQRPTGESGEPVQLLGTVGGAR